MKKFKNIKLMLVGLFCLIGMNSWAVVPTPDRYEVVNGMIYGVQTGEDGAVFMGVLANISGEWDWSEKAEIVIPESVNLKNDAGTGRKDYDVVCVSANWFNAQTLGSLNSQAIAGASVKKLSVACRLDYNATASEEGFGWSALFADIDPAVWVSLEELTISNAHDVASLAFGLTGAFPALKTLNLGGVTNDGRPIEIPANFVKGSAKLENLTLPSTDPLIIGANAFEGTALATLTIPANVKEIGADAFANSAKLKTVNINSAKLTEVGAWFTGCTAIETISINSESIAKIAAGAFASATGLQNLTIAGDALTTVESGAFATGLATLVNVDLAGTQLENIDKICTPKDSKATLEKFFFPATLTGTLPTFEGCTKLDKINAIPKGVDALLGKAFYDCQKLEAIDLSGTQVTTIPANAFEMPTNDGTNKVNGIQQKKTVLATVTLNANTKEIQASAFAGCSKLATVNLDALTKLETLGTNAFEGTIIETVDLSASTAAKFVTIPASAFANNTALKSVTLPAQITTIAASAFEFDGDYGKGKLESVNFEDLTVLATLGAKAFNGGIFADVDLSTNTKLTTIPTKAFANNIKLETVKLPIQIGTVEPQAFCYDKALSSLNLYQTNIVVLENLFTEDGDPSDESKGAAGLKELKLKKDETLKDKDGKAIELKPIVTIAEYALQFTGLTGIVIPSTVTAFGVDTKSTKKDDASPADGSVDNGRVFQGCTSLTEFEWVNVDKSITSLPKFCFLGNTALKTVKFLTTATAAVVKDAEVFYLCNGVEVYLTADSYKATEADGYGNDNRQYSVLKIEGNKVFKFTENGKASDGYYYATYYNQENSSWFDATKFDVYSAVIEGSKVVLKKATADGGYYKVAKFDPSDSKTSKTGLAIVRSMDIKAVPELNSNGGNMSVSTLPNENELKYQGQTTVQNAKGDWGINASKIKYQFKLGNKNGQVAFWRVTSGVIKEGVVYVEGSVPTARFDFFVEGEGEVTGIENIFAAEEDNAPVYNLQGARVNNAQKGVYIKNGKKFIVK